MCMCIYIYIYIYMYIHTCLVPLEDGVGLQGLLLVEAVGAPEEVPVRPHESVHLLLVIICLFVVIVMCIVLYYMLLCVTSALYV